MELDLISRLPRYRTTLPSYGRKAFDYPYLCIVSDHALFFEMDVDAYHTHVSPLSDFTHPRGCWLELTDVDHIEGSESFEGFEGRHSSHFFALDSDFYRKFTKSLSDMVMWLYPEGRAHIHALEYAPGKKQLKPHCTLKETPLTGKGVTLWQLVEDEQGGVTQVALEVQCARSGLPEGFEQPVYQERFDSNRHCFDPQRIASKIRKKHRKTLRGVFDSVYS